MRVLALLPQNPSDVTSRTARLTIGACSALRAAGCDVRVLATSATEHPDKLSALARLRHAGIEARILDARSGGRVRPELHFASGGIAHRVVDVGKLRAHEWEAPHGTAFDAALRDEVASFAPDAVLAWPDCPGRRLRKLGDAGTRVIQVAADSRWLQSPPDVLAEADAILCPTEWMAELYRERCGSVPVTALAPAVDGGAVVPETAERECLTIVDPSVDGGVFFLLRLCEEIGLRRPDLPVLVVASSHAAANTAHAMVKAGLAAGFDLRRHENLLFAEPAPNPKELWAPARVLLAPVLANPPVDLLAEALANGVPPLMGDRGGWPEVDAGRVLPLPLDYDRSTGRPVAAVDVEPWLEAIEELDDDGVWAAERERALAQAAAFSPEALAPEYRAFLERVLG
ncbi:MAG: hypothetical protein R2729_30785 [Bryobacteraceae bacterium]